jgi:hypothetical protein
MAEEKLTDDKKNTDKLRAQAATLLAQARNQLGDIQRALGGINGNSALHARLAAAASNLSGIVSELSQAVDSPFFSLRAADLMAIETAVQSGEAHAALAAAGAQAGTNATIGSNLTIASTETRHETQALAHDVFAQHIFDRYLRFSSAEDEAAYRKREADAKKYIADQLARHTPEGDLNAGGGMIGQMLDAHAHGAGDSPDFMPRWNTLVEKIGRQRDAMQAAGQSTAEFDSHVTTSLRSYLKAKRLSDAEIDARLKAYANPLDAAKGLLKDDRDSHYLERKIREAGPMDHAASASRRARRQRSRPQISCPGEGCRSLRQGWKPARAETAACGFGSRQPGPEGGRQEDCGVENRSSGRITALFGNCIQ